MQNYPDFPNLPAMMLGLARRWPHRPMLRYHRDGAWRSITWGQFGRLAAICARDLRAAGVAPGDRVLIVADNRPEYSVAEVALMAIRAIPVPTYTSNTVADHAHVIGDCGATLAIAGNAAQAERLAETGLLERQIILDDTGWATAAHDNSSGDLDLDILTAQADGIGPGALACLIYTSGTGGAPKGVMLSHAAILSNCRGAFELLRPLKLQDEIYLSFLPLSHAYEHTVGQYFLTSIGSELVYSRGAEHLAIDMRTVRPTVMTVVPRVLEVIHARVLTQLRHEPRWRQALFRRALAIGLDRLDGKPLSMFDRLLDPLLDRLVRTKMRARFGGRLKGVMSGGARLEPQIGRFFLALGLRILQGYGQTEAGPVISANPPDAIRIDTVGIVLEGVDLRIAEDGEILVRGDLMMTGYWGQPAATDAAIRDGWLHTGDIGELDADGYLRITDRKRDLIVLSSGDNVSPARIEGMLIAEPEIAQAVVGGEGQAGLSALLVPADGFDDSAVAGAVSRVNQRLAVTERIRKHAIVVAFTVENGLLTPTQKIRRRAVLERFAAGQTDHSPAPVRPEL